MIPDVAGRIAGASERAQRWVDERDPASKTGVAIDAWRRYRTVDGPLQSALLSLYILVAVIPALLVLDEYLNSNPAALADHIVHHYGLNAATAGLIRGVLVDDHSHKLGSAIFAIVGALVFGLGFGRVLQLVHVRAWRITVPTRQSDQALYAVVLMAIYGLILLLLVQLDELRGSPVWVGWTLAIGWVALLVWFFAWAPWRLTHKQISRRELLPASVLTAVGLVALMLISRFVMQFWVDLYAQDYGGLGVILAIYFWLAISSAVIVWAAALAPALAQRRDLRSDA